MKPGMIFTINEDAITKMEQEEYSVVWRDSDKNILRLSAGTRFRIPSKGLLGLPLEVRASKINETTGKCTRGRPRRFPAAVVYTLFGETAPDPSTLVAQVQPVVSTPVATMKEEVLVVEQTEEEIRETEEENNARVARVEALLGLAGDSSDDTDW